jgi:hypothetical protein
MDVLGHAVSFAHQIATHAFKANAITRQKCRVVLSLGNERVDQREQDGGVGIGTDRNPLRRGGFRTVFANGTS